MIAPASYTALSVSKLPPTVVGSGLLACRRQSDRNGAREDTGNIWIMSRPGTLTVTSFSGLDLLTQPASPARQATKCDGLSYETG